MPARTVLNFEQQTSITTTSDEFIVNPAREVNAALILTAGTPVTGARLQVTLDEESKITAGTATWVNSPLGTHTFSAIEKALRPITGIRLSATDGTWTLQVRQA